MVDFINNWLTHYGINENLSLCLSSIVTVTFILFISLASYTITKSFLLKFLKLYILKSKNTWDDILIKRKVFDQITFIVPALIIHAFASAFPAYQNWIEKLAFSYIVIIVLLSIDKLLDVIDDIYRNHKISREKPIKGYLQVLKIFIYVIGIIIIISVVLDRSPWGLLSGIGAATAVLLLVFQNSILGFVAGIQLSSNNMVQIGDWIEMPKYNADGDVIDIALHTVKVQNWDKTITTIPTTALISDSFRNWRGMQNSGGRRIKRSIFIDMTSIKFCTEEMLKRYKRIQYIQKYIDDKIKEIEKHNKINNINIESIVNGRHLTNIGTFRAYVENYLKNHPKLHKGMTQMVRQLQPTENGLPLEIYVFTNDTAWVNYESIQSDIFDHILSIIPEFDLRIYQNPTGHDLRNLINK